MKDIILFMLGVMLVLSIKLLVWERKRRVMKKLKFIDSFGEWTKAEKMVFGTVHLYEDRKSDLDLFDNMIWLAEKYEYDEDELTAAIEDLTDLGVIRNHSRKEWSLTEKGKKLAKLDPSRIGKIDPTKRRVKKEIDWIAIARRGEVRII